MNNDTVIRQLFDTANQQVSLNTRYRLEQIRHSTLRQDAASTAAAPKRPLRLLFGAGAVAMALFAAALILPNYKMAARQAAAPVAQVTTDPVSRQGADVLNVDDSTTWDEDPAFYAWLSSPEATALAQN